MSSQIDIDYLLMREAEERLRAASSPNPAVRSAHFEMAERYADAVWSAEEKLVGTVRASGLWPQHDIPSRTTQVCLAT